MHHTLRTSMFVPRPRAEVFAFFRRHGLPALPALRQQFARFHMERQAEAVRDSRVRVIGRGHADVHQGVHLGELGLVPGTPFHLLSCAPFKGPLRLQMKPQDHVIGYELAASLWVEVTKSLDVIRFVAKEMSQGFSKL